MTTPEFVTVGQARAHMRVPAGTDDSDLELKIAAATQLVCEHIADRHPADSAWIAEIESWTNVDPPPVVVLAVLEQVAEFYRFRGDDEETPQERWFLAPSIETLLSRYRNRAFA